MQGVLDDGEPDAKAQAERYDAQEEACRDEDEGFQVLTHAAHHVSR